MKKLNKGVQVNEKKIRILLYANGIVLLSEYRRDLQQVLDTLNNGARTGDSMLTLLHAFPES